MDVETLSPAETRDLERLTKAMVEICIRNTGLEDLHAGRFPVSRTGDFTDVTVVTPDGTIPWTELSRISDAEMKTLMIEFVDRVFTYMRYPEARAGLSGGRTWDRPKLDEQLMKTVRRRQAQAGTTS